MMTFDDDLEAVVEAHEEVKKNLLAKYQQELVLLEERMRIAIQEFEDKILKARGQRIKMLDEMKIHRGGIAKGRGNVSGRETIAHLSIGNITHGSCGRKSKF